MNDLEQKENEINPSPKTTVILLLIIAIFLSFILSSRFLDMFLKDGRIKEDSSQQTYVLNENQIQYIETSSKIFFKDFIVLLYTDSETEFNEAKNNLESLCVEKSPAIVFVLSKEYENRTPLPKEIDIVSSSVINLQNNDGKIQNKLTYLENITEKTVYIYWVKDGESFKVYDIK